MKYIRPILRLQNDVIMLALYPKISHNSDVISEVIFVVDRYCALHITTLYSLKRIPLCRSGSMEARGKMLKVRDSLQIMLRSLPLGALFNVILPFVLSLHDTFLDYWIWDLVFLTVCQEPGVFGFFTFNSY